MMRNGSAERARTRRGVRVAAALVAGALAVVTAGEGCAAELAAQTGMRYDAWRGSGSRASQFQIPVRISGRAGDFSASLLTAHVYTTSKPAGGEEASLSTLVDTKLATSYEVVGKLPVDVLFALDFNLPTGKTDLSKNELSIDPDPELLPIDTFGEGFNVNPSVTVAKSWGRVAAGLGVGYLWRGSYDVSSDVRLEDYDPGDVGNLTGEVRWAFAPAWEARFLGEYAHYGTDELSGDEILREGDFLSLLAEARWLGDPWGASLSVQTIFRGKNEFPDAGGGGLETEDQNAATRLTAAARGLWVTENDYPSSSSRHVGARDKISVTVGAARKLSQAVEAGVDLGGFYLHDDKANFPEPRGERNYRGITVAAKVTADF
jgi:hypothetical protein